MSKYISIFLKGDKRPIELVGDKDKLEKMIKEAELKGERMVQVTETISINRKKIEAIYPFSRIYVGR